MPQGLLFALPITFISLNLTSGKIPPQELSPTCKINHRAIIAEVLAGSELFEVLLLLTFAHRNGC